MKKFSTLYFLTKRSESQNKEEDQKGPSQATINNILQFARSYESKDSEILNSFEFNKN